MGGPSTTANPRGSRKCLASRTPMPPATRPGYPGTRRAGNLPGGRYLAVSARWECNRLCSRTGRWADFSPTAEIFYASVAVLITDLQPALATHPDGDIPPSYPAVLAELTEYAQAKISRAVYYKRLREAPGEDNYKKRFHNGPNIPLSDAVLFPEDWEIIFARRRLPALIRPSASSFLRMWPAYELFFPQQLWAVMMRIFLGC